MARGRMLNNKISASRQMNDLLPDDTCRLLATWMVAHLDKNGVFYGEPVMVKSYVFPRRADVSVEDVEGYLLAMEKAELIVRFVARGERWQWWPAFEENQIGMRPDRESTTFPLPPTMEEEPPEVQTDAVPAPDADSDDAGKMPEDCRKDDGNLPVEVNRREGKVSLREDNIAASAAPSTPGGPSPPAGLTEGQRFWLQSFGAKRFANTVQREAVMALERDYGTERLEQGVRWAAKQGMTMGRALTALETALPKWDKPKGGDSVTVGGV
jgi:hypothetical protein